MGDAGIIGDQLTLKGSDRRSPQKVKEIHDPGDLFNLVPRLRCELDLSFCKYVKDS